MQQSPTNREDESAGSQTTLYQRVGGIPYFKDLVDRFYRYVEADAVLRTMYPDDLEPGKYSVEE